MRKLVSVIMSTYNEEPKYIFKALESIINQTYSNLEIIVVIDNPNNKEAISVVKELSLNDRRIIVLENEKNIGLVKSLNKALTVCKGDYIARMDADDISDLNRISIQLDYVEKNDVDIIGSKVEYINSDNEIIINEDKRPIESSKIKKRLKIENCIAHPSWFVKSNVYKELDGYRDIHACEDYDFLLRSINKGYKIANVNSKLLKYRINENGISSSNGIKQFLIANYLRKNLKRIFQIDSNEINKYIESLNNSKSFKNYKSDLEKMRNSNLFTKIKIGINNKIIREVVVYKLKASIL